LKSGIKNRPESLVHSLDQILDIMIENDIYIEDIWNNINSAVHRRVLEALANEEKPYSHTTIEKYDLKEVRTSKEPSKVWKKRVYSTKTKLSILSSKNGSRENLSEIDRSNSYKRVETKGQQIILLLNIFFATLFIYTTKI